MGSDFTSILGDDIGENVVVFVLVPGRKDFLFE